MSVRPPGGNCCCRLTQKPMTPIGVPRGTDAISAPALEGGSSRARCIGGENGRLQDWVCNLCRLVLPPCPARGRISAGGGVGVGQVCGLGAASSPMLSSRSLQCSAASVLRQHRAGVGPAGNRLDGGAGDGDTGSRCGLPGMLGMALRGKQPLPISCIRWEAVGEIPGREQEAKACPQRTCPVLGVHKGGLSHSPSSAEPCGGHFCLAFCSMSHQHGRYPGVLGLGIP